MKVIKEKEEFYEFYTKFKNSFDFKNNPSELVNEKYKFKFESDYELIMFPCFFENAIELCKHCHSTEFVFMVLKPSPTKYFYKHFGSFNTYVFDMNDNKQTYKEILNHDPGNSPADSPISNSFLVLVADIKCNWFIIANRSYEKSVAYFKDKYLYNSAIDIFSDDIQG